MKDQLTLSGDLLLQLRYGENPHQKASFYTFAKSSSPLKKLKRLWGRELSLVNLTDINAGLEAVRLFEEPAAVVIKHNSPCGIALGKDGAQALQRAIDADPESAFGGVIVLNRTFDDGCFKIVAQFKASGKGNFDIIAVPILEKGVFEKLSALRKSMGIYTFGKIPKKNGTNFNIKFVDGGFIVQNRDEVEKGFGSWEAVTKKKPTKKQLQQMKIGWKFISRIRSNCVLVVDQNLPKTCGIGSGQTSRVRATKIALEQAGKKAQGGILVSDSFFPFADSVELAIKAGISAVIQQGESINDALSIEAANKAGIPMVLTHHRAFWH
ncbi:hypothetical protein HY385_00255 [Candidatus Daviesbacteria bacterium]|nr:hypothetical protein [Candidatus Daviesbacteria bacterium]